MKDVLTRFLTKKVFSFPFFALLCLNLTGLAIGLFCFYYLTEEVD